MQMFGVGVAFGPVARVDRATALGRSRYQRPRGTQKEGSRHVQGWTLTPREAPVWAQDCEQLWRRAAQAERRWDAREAYFFDFSWPRCLPLDQLDEVVHEIYDRFVDRGLVAQVDCEIKTAADGGDNPHLHALLSTRAIGPSGFGRQKARWVNDVFHSMGGRWARRVVAAALTEAAHRAGLDVGFDPRTNRERGLPVAEDRLPRWVLRHPDGPKAQNLLTQRARQRANAETYRETERQLAALEAELATLSDTLQAVVDGLLVVKPVRRPAAASAAIDLVAASRLRSALRLPGDDPVIELAGLGIVIPVGAGSVVDCGSMVRLERAVDHDVARTLAALCAHKGWTEVTLTDPAPHLPRTLNWYDTGREPDPDHRVTPGALRAAQKLAARLRSPDADRGLLLSRLDDAARQDGSDDVRGLLAQIGICALLDIDPPDAKDIVAALSRQSPPGAAGLWVRYRAELQLAMIDLPGNRLGNALEPARQIRWPSLAVADTQPVL